ncbi:MAG: hypothetical protein RIR28_909, partial [Pseudomonadota bacterium]
MSLAAPVGMDVADKLRRGARVRVATKYLQTARQFFESRGVHADLIKLYGSMELAPLVGLADVIVDLVSTGATLAANGLVEVEPIAQVSSRLIVNQTALKTQHAALSPIIEDFARQSKA